MWRRILVSALAILALGISQPVSAMTIDPESVTLHIDSGAVAQQVVTIANDSDRLRTYSASLVQVDFGTSAEDLRFSALAQPYRDWIELSTGSLEVAANASEELTVTVTTPNDAGSRDTFVFAVLVTEQLPAGSGVLVGSGLASLHFVNVSGGEAPELRIEAFETIPANTYHLPLRFAALIHNVGTGLSEPGVFVEIRNWRGGVIETLSLNDLGRRIPGQTQRIFSTEWVGRIAYVGPYTATLVVLDSATDTPQTAVTNVVLFPWQLLVLFSAAILVLVIVVAVFARAKRR